MRGRSANERRAGDYGTCTEQGRDQEGASAHGGNVNRSLLSWNEESVEGALRDYASGVTYTLRSRGPSNSQKKIPCQRPSAS